MEPAPSLKELRARSERKDYAEFVRGAMRDFCFTINAHTGQDQVWFGTFTVTINRNVAFNFFERDVSGDDALEPFPVVRGERTEAVEVRVRPHPDDPSADYVVPVFRLEKREYDQVMRSMGEILRQVGDLRTIPDVCFEDEPLIALICGKLLTHPAVKAERAADWPSFLK
jgi:hypothetical protein